MFFVRSLLGSFHSQFFNFYYAVYEIIISHESIFVKSPLCYTIYMTIHNLRLANVRSYDLYQTAFDPSLTLILGKNGTGKTTLLESIYYLMQGTSFRGRDRDMIAHSSNRGDLYLDFDDGQSRRGTLEETPNDAIKKSFLVNDTRSQRLLARHRLPVVMFEPDELRLLTSSPERRRKFFDGVLARLYPQYATILNRYSRTLLQRNELLKRREDIAPEAWESQLFVWDMKFAGLAVEITRQRREFIMISNAELSQIYSEMAGADHHVAVNYHSSLSADNYEQHLLDTLHKNRIADSYRGYTTAGPHRDDFLLTLDGHLATEVASRGEMRTIMLALKLLEVQLQQTITKRTPLVLLDDVFSELDTSREQALITALKGHQTIITATHLRDELTSSASIIRL